MAQRGLEQRVAELEQRVAELQQRTAAPDWRQALGMFTDRPEMLEVFKDAVKVREADRKRTHKSVRNRRAKRPRGDRHHDSDRQRSLLHHRQSTRSAARCVSRPAWCGQDVIAVPTVVVEEVLRGRLAKLRRVLKPDDWIGPYEQLAESVRFLSHFVIAPWTPGASQQMAPLRQAKIRIGTQDLKIAAIALDNNAILISANLQDFTQVPGLRVENWLR